MKQSILSCIVSAVALSAVFAVDGWETNLDAAKKKAAEEGKGLLIEFTGSDWCGPCIGMKQNVFVKDEFLDKAKASFVLVELDYPQKKEQSQEEKALNKQHSAAYAITGFPTIVFTDKDGKPVHMSVGGIDLPSTLKQIDKAIENKAFVEKSLAEYKNLPDNDRLKLIGEIARRVPLRSMAEFYPELVAEIEKDKENVSGVALEYNEQKQSQAFKKYKKDMPKAFVKDSAKMYEYYDAYLQNDNLPPSIKQEIYSLQASSLMTMEKLDEAIERMEMAVKAAPDTPPGEAIAGQLQYFKANKEMILETVTQNNLIEKYEASLPVDVRKDVEKYCAAIQKLIDGDTLNNSGRQIASLRVVMALVANDKEAEAMAILDKGIGLAPDTEQGRMLTQYKEAYGRMKDNVVMISKRDWETRMKAADEANTPQS